MSFLINTPPSLDGDNAAKIKQLYTHLYQMSEQVNYALNALASGDVVDLTGTLEARKTFSTAIMGGDTITSTPSLETYNELKSLIIKTGNTVNESISILDEKIYGENGTVSELNQSISDLDIKWNENIQNVNSHFDEQIENLISEDSSLLEKLNIVDELANQNKTDITANDEAIKQSLADEVSALKNSIKEESESLDSKISETNKSLSNLDGTVSEQGEKIIDVESDLSQAQSDISTNTTNIETNKNDITGLKEISFEIEQAFGVNSEYGSYAEAISNQMSISAKNVIQEFEIVSRLDSADEKATGFAEWINVTDSYIKTGILYTDSETGLEQVGVAIGTNIATSIVDGVIQPDATKTDLLATFVSDSLIFWQNGRKVAYFSNKKLYVLSAEFLGSYRIGDFQWVNADVGLILEWVGEDSGK